jgi:hypothetical protein
MLVIIFRLLLLKSSSVTNNLLVNYVYLILNKYKINGDILKKMDPYSELMNAEITLAKNE